jgi:cytochrome bd ubiquinol oxidase subunit I
MRVREAVTGAKGIPVGYGTLVVVYIALGTVALFMLRRLARTPPETELAPGPGKFEVLP